MPELPEVHTISQDLKNNIVGFEIKNIQVAKNYRIPEDQKKKLAQLKGKKILDSHRIAKNIVLEISENEFLVFHLAMTGRILLRKDKEEKDNWVKIVFEILKNDKTMYLKFCDMRQFGKVRVINRDELETLQNKYGIDVLRKEISPEEFLKLLKRKKSTVKNVLLDQSIISGLGNIYATDTLFLSEVNPKTATQDLTLKQSEQILKYSREILKEGIKNRGSTLPDKMYVDIFGKSGTQQNYFRIYGKNICPVCKTKTMFEKINGRGTYYCPTCQPLKIVNQKVGKDLKNKTAKISKNKLEQKKLL